MSTGSKVYRIFKQLFDVETHERTKLFFLTAAFFFVIGGYTVAKELKDAIFMHIVGKEYIPIARTMVMFALMPAIFCYSKLVDRMRRYQLLNFFSIFFAISGLIFAYLIGHPTIGLANTNTGPHRWFGWLFYLFVEGYSPFLVSVFWAFANSITGPATFALPNKIATRGSFLLSLLPPRQNIGAVFSHHPDCLLEPCRAIGGQCGRPPIRRFRNSALRVRRKSRRQRLRPWTSPSKGVRPPCRRMRRACAARDQSAAGRQYLR